MEEEVLDPAPANQWDSLVEELQAQRERVGNPSYGKVADLITDARVASGLNVHAARVGRTTVYDAFRTGRPRINLPFLREVATALGATSEQFDEWVAAVNAEVEEPEPDSPVTLKFIVGLMLTCLALNMLGRVIVDWLSLPIYLDMVGTALAAIALGPWRGAIVGGTTNVVGALTSSWVSLPFAIVNIAGALVWGYGVRRFNMGRTLPRFFALNLVVALTCSLLAVPILVLLFGGSVGQGQDTITQTFIDLGNGLLVAVGFSNLMTSTGDKLISGFVAMVGVSMLPLAYRRRVPLVMVEGQ